jgi:hypothetical protein
MVKLGEIEFYDTQPGVRTGLWARVIWSIDYSFLSPPRGTGFSN